MITATTLQNSKKKYGEKTREKQINLQSLETKRFFLKLKKKGICKGT